MPKKSKNPTTKLRKNLRNAVNLYQAGLIFTVTGRVLDPRNRSAAVVKAVENAAHGGVRPETIQRICGDDVIRALGLAIFTITPPDNP